MTAAHWRALAEGATYVLLDVGGVLCHDEPVQLHYLSRVHHRLSELSVLPDPDPGWFFRRREELLRDGDRDWIHSLGGPLAGDHWKRVVARSWDETLSCWAEVYPPCDGAADAVAALAAEHRLACAANQPAVTRSLLDARGLSRYFDHVLLDAEFGVSKPDERFFRCVLKRLGVESHQAVYIGDRIDNDVAPARRLGLRTVWVRRPPRRFRVAGVAADFAAAHAASLERRWHHNPFSGGDLADLTVTDLASLTAAEAGV